MKFIEYSSKYEKQVITLLNICFPKKNISQNSFHWKYLDNFYKQKEIIFIAVENNKVCSFVSFSPYEICNNNKLHNNFFICTLQATHPKYRRKGYISILTKKAEQKIYKKNKNVSFIGFSNNYGIQIDKKSKTIAYKIIHQFTSVRIPSCYFSSLYSKNISFAEIKAPLNKKNIFSKKISQEYIKWRYEKNPIIDYKAINIFNDTTQKKIATVIYSKNKYTIDIYNILYYETNIDKKNIFTYLSQFAREQKKIYSTYSFISEEIKKNIPFFSLTKKINIFLTIKSEEALFLDNKNWRLETGDIL